MRTDEKKINRWLPVKLTDTESLEYGRIMSERVKEKTALEAEKAAKMRDYGEQLKKLNGEIARLSGAISTGEENRNVPCLEFKDFDDDKFVIIRLDTNEVLTRRKLYDEEKQKDMFG